MQTNDRSAEIQNKMTEVQKKLATITVEGKSGTEGYSVKIYLNGNYEATKVIVDPELLKQSTEVLGDLIASAVTDATRKTTAAIQKEMFSILQGF